ncbi:hypothetical protein [Brucella intermedia]|uniref:hypothetical protein n=1 Tax=Brucella intermedia TaxID=94625 RepID=UPI00224A67D0|nr:hypothetical protein [Brucella intermedia]
MKRSSLILGCMMTMLTTLPAVSSEKPLIEMTDVDRDTVPAGTPAAFEVAFPQASQNEAVRKIGDDNFHFVPLAFIPLSDTRTALVSTGANECTGAACSGMNAVHYLDHEAGEPRYPFTLRGEWLNVGAVGSVGNPAERWGWSSDISDVPVLYTEGGGGGQGLFCYYAILTELTDSGPVELARIPIEYSNASSDDNSAQINGAITAAEKGRSLTVSYKSGTETFQEIYHRAEDGRFRLDGQTRVPSC